MPGKIRRTVWIVGVLGALLGCLATLGVLWEVGLLRSHAPPDREAMVHEKGGMVMPFALDSTTHVFEMTDSGGVQDVVAKDPADSAQITLIRRHLMHEAELFRNGDFSDPASIHGKSMPGLQALSAGAKRIRIEYTALPNGGRITYSTSDPKLITAVHRWFGAQLSDHGTDATYR
ncbi:MAG: hypothetical protein LJF06_09565 [Gemmatimonadetes bacterium]|nr:hypothetical protein [Gemmatimonadota bacterium]